MTKFFQWRDEYNLNIKEIDDQHKYFVDLLNDIYKSIINSDDQIIVVKKMEELEKHIANHFSTEERYFDKFSYLGSEEHKLEHQKLKDELTSFRDRFVSGESGASFALVDFLENWMLYHLADMDRKYVDCFHENGLF